MSCVKALLTFSSALFLFIFNIEIYFYVILNILYISLHFQTRCMSNNFCVKYKKLPVHRIFTETQSKGILVVVGIREYTNENTNTQIDVSKSEFSSSFQCSWCGTISGPITGFPHVVPIIFILSQIPVLFSTSEAVRVVNVFCDKRIKQMFTSWLRWCICSGLVTC